MQRVRFRLALARKRIQSLRYMQSDNQLTDFLPMQDLDTDHIRALIHHYLKLKHRMPDNLSVRERLVELQDELFKRRTTHYDSN